MEPEIVNGTPAPTEIQGQTPPAAPAPVGDAGASGSAGAAPSTGVAPAGTSPPAGVANPAAAAQAQGVRDVLGQLGLQTQQFGSDHAALQYLVAQAQQAQQLQQLAPFAQQYMQYAGPFQQWMAAQQAQQAQQRAQQQKWWEAPEYDPSWSQKIYRDPQTGELKTIPGTDPAIIQKYQKWTEHQQGFLNRFSQDPLAAIKPGIEQLIEQKAQALFQQQYAQIQEQQTAQSFIHQNSEWLHERDAQGQLIQDPRSGRPMLSGMGRVFAQYVSEAEGLGLRDSNSQQRYAMTALQRDFLLAQRQQGAGGGQAQVPGQTQQADAVKQQFLQQAAGVAAQPGQAVGQAAGSYVPTQGPSIQGLREQMARDFAAAGIAPGSVLER